MNDFSIKVESNEIMRFLDDYTDIVFKAKQAALRKAAQILKDNTLKSLRSTGINVDGRSNKYDDTLADGVTITKIKDGDKIGVHILGNRRSSSGTYRLRFFEKDTRERYQKTKNGVRRTGKITGHHFFENAVNSSSSDVEHVLHDTLEKYIRKAWEQYG